MFRYILTSAILLVALAGATSQEELYYQALKAEEAEDIARALSLFKAAVAEPGPYTEEIQRVVGLQLLVEAEHFRRIHRHGPILQGLHSPEKKEEQGIHRHQADNILATEGRCQLGHLNQQGHQLSRIYKKGAETRALVVD